MNKNIYTFPSIFTFEDDGISVYFPDLPGCLTCGDNLEEALYNAKEAMELHLYGEDIIPRTTPLDKIKVRENQIVRIIEGKPLMPSEVIDMNL